MGKTDSALKATSSLPHRQMAGDSEMIAYPHVFDHRSDRHMLYCGDGFGSTGFGSADTRVIAASDETAATATAMPPDQSRRFPALLRPRARHLQFRDRRKRVWRSSTAPRSPSRAEAFSESPRLPDDHGHPCPTIGVSMPAWASAFSVRSASESANVRTHVDVIQLCPKPS